MNQDLKSISKSLREDIVNIAFATQKGHLLSSFSIVDLLTCLYFKIMNIDKSLSDDRDYFILSKGHACLALYCVLAKKNIIDHKLLETFCHVDGILGGHPSRKKVPGIEASTGSLGHGPSIGVGIALGLKIKEKTNKVIVMVGDGECNEGSVWEAALAANKHRLANFWVIVDANKYQSYDKTSVICPLEPLDKKWESFGFNCCRINLTENRFALIEAFEKMKELNGPKCIIADGIKGLGLKSFAGNLNYHHIRKMDESLRDQMLAEID